MKINQKEVTYKILNPGGNQTALVLGNEYTKEERQQINASILNENPEVEQVGFLATTEKRLEMAGGEFCVNATRCAIWQYLAGQPGEIELEVSGFSGKIQGGITPEKEVYAEMQIGQTMENLIETKR